MYCPNCGKQNSIEQKFCPSCGLSLEKAAQSLTDQLPTSLRDQELENRQRLVDRMLSIILGGTLSLAIAGIIGYGIIYRLIIVKGVGLQAYAFLVIMLGVIASLALVIYRESLKDSAAKRKMSQAAFDQIEPGGGVLPEFRFEPISSVTEHTTRQLVSKQK